MDAQTSRHLFNSAIELHCNLFRGARNNNKRFGSSHLFLLAFDLASSRTMGSIFNLYLH